MVDLLECCIRNKHSELSIPQITPLCLVLEVKQEINLLHACPVGSCIANTMESDYTIFQQL